MSMRSTLILLATGCALACGGFEPQLAEAKDAELDIDVELEVGQPTMLADSSGTAYIKLSLKGFKPPTAKHRAPINLALVIDRSSSMSGDKIVRAKEAAVMVLDSLRPDDVISVITYDSTVDVLVPATPADDRGDIRKRIMALEPRGSTALFAGVSHGIEQAKKFKSADRVNRVILLSDGQANVGPSSPAELGRLGERAGRMGISITTIGLGLGYNEDLMANLALRSDGNHGFAEHADDLATMFKNELGDITSVVAADIEIEIEFDKDVTPIRGLNRDLSIRGNKAKVSFNQLYAAQEKYILIEARVPAHKAGQTSGIAAARVDYRNVISKKKRRVKDDVKVAFSRSRKTVESKENRGVMVAATEAQAVRESARAIALRDRGQVAQAEKVLRQNSDRLAKQAKRYKSKRLKKLGAKNRKEAQQVKKKDWNRTRKKMTKDNYASDNNMSW